jgi:hypothetical protein
MSTISEEAGITVLDSYWGDGGEYGPFKEQQTGEWAGWPDFGDVMRYFRNKAGYSYQEFAELYQGATNSERPITRRQVERMELESQVPVNINRRKLIARLLNIPPMLFGLATLKQVTLKPHPEVAGAVTKTGHTTLTRVAVDITKYQRNIRTLLTLHHTSQAQKEIYQINADIRDLESLESQARGDLLYHIRELLFSYHLLAAKMVNDQRKFSLSHYYANQAVRVAKAMEDTDMIATALYTRGCAYLWWGMFGTLAKGVFQIQLDKINSAICNFEDAKKAHKNTEKSLHPQLEGLIDVHLSRAYAIRNLSTGQRVPALAIMLLDGAEEKADRQSIDDPYTRELVTGSRIGFIKESYHNDRAAAFNSAKMSGAALKEIKIMEALREGTIGKDLTREQIWLDIVAANTFMGLEQFEEATKRARRVLVASHDINSVTNFAKVVDIHGRLLKSPYKHDPDVKELGDMIHEAITNRIEQDEEQLMEGDY